MDTVEHTTWALNHWRTFCPVTRSDVTGKTCLHCGLDLSRVTKGTPMQILVGRDPTHDAGQLIRFTPCVECGTPNAASATTCAMCETPGTPSWERPSRRQETSVHLGREFSKAVLGLVIVGLLFLGAFGWLFFPGSIYWGG